MIELEENKHKLISLKERLKSIGEALRIVELKKEIKELEAKTNEQGFWDNNQESSSVLTKMKRLLKEISNLLGEPEPYEIERKFLIKYPDIKYGIKLCNKNIGFNGKFYTFPYFLTFLLKKFTTRTHA